LEDGENMTIPLGGKKFLRCSVLAAALVGLLGFAATPRAFAHDYDDYDRCQRRIYKADHKLHEAIERHGWYSRQAEHARHELREARERCWRERHRWWDEDGRRWHSDRDWDDRDHDRH
jgi:hypothetical protein